MPDLSGQTCLLRACLVHAPVNIAVLDRELRFVATSAQYLQMMGLSGQDLTGQQMYEVFPEIPQHWREMHRACLTGTESSADAERMQLADGSYAYWTWKLAPWFAPDGAISGMILAAHNATAEVAREHEVRRNAMVLEQANIGIGIVSAPDSILLYVNTELAALHGYTAEAMLGMSVQDTFPAAERARVTALQGKSDAGGGVRFESDRFRRDGTTFPALTHIKTVSADGDYLAYRIGTVIDLTGITQAESARRAALDDLSALIQLGPGVLWRKHVTGSDIVTLETRGDLMRLALPGQSIEMAESLVAEVQASPTTLSRLHALQADPDAHTGSVDILVTHPGLPDRWVRDAIRIVSRTADSAEMVGYLTDVTPEILELQRLRQAATLITMGEMATSMAHELRQPLSTISFAAQNIEMLFEQQNLSAELIGKKIRKIVAETQRASRLIDHMKVFGRHEHEHSGPQSWLAALAGARELLAQRLRGYSLQDTLPADLPDVAGSPILMEQVLMNLIGNAMDAYESHDGGGVLHTIAITGGVEGQQVVVRVSDAAGGIPDAVIGRVFEPFFTTKLAGKGTGLGLSVCFGTITEMGGTLSAHNAGGGAVFEIRLPIAPAGDGAAQNPG